MKKTEALDIFRLYGFLNNMYLLGLLSFPPIWCVSAAPPWRQYLINAIVIFLLLMIWQSTSFSSNISETNTILSHWIAKWTYVQWFPVLSIVGLLTFSKYVFKFVGFFLLSEFTPAPGTLTSDLFIYLPRKIIKYRYFPKYYFV